MSELSESKSDAQNVKQSADPALVWVSHPARKSTGRLVLAISVILIGAIISGWLMDAPGFGIVVALVMFFSLSKFFFPTRYSFNETGITVKTTTQTFTREWKLFRSYYIDPNGILLSPFSVPSRLENFRGLYLTFSGNRDQVVEFVKAHVKAPTVPGLATETNKD